MCPTWNRSGSSSTKSTRCGFPMETALAVSVMPPPTSNGCPRNVSQAGPRIGIDAFVNPGTPISTVTRCTSPPSSCSRSRRTPPPVSIPNSWLLRQPQVVHQLAHAPGAVAAHLRDAAVRVAVVHHERRVGPLRPKEPYHAVGSHPRAAIAHRRDELRLQGTRVVQVDEHDEVVAAALILGESQFVRHSSSHGRVRCSRIGSSAVIALGPTTSNHRMRGSRRNHDICRRARLPVRLTVASTAASIVMSPRR